MNNKFQKQNFQRSYLLLCFSFLLCPVIYGQQKLSNKETEKLADSFYNKKNYPQATFTYLSIVEQTDFPGKKAGLLYNIACCLSLQEKKDSALYFLKRAIETGYSNKKNVLADPDLVALHNSPQWDPLVKTIVETGKVLNDDPAKARFFTDDIHRFWNAYDKALKDTLRFKEIFKENYFSKASRGMNDYMGLKVSSIDFFIDHVRSAPEFYKAIKTKTLQVDDHKKEFFNSFLKLKSIYGPAKFPDVYFVIGAFTSAGTVSDAGLLIGVNQVCQATGIPTNELSARLRTRLMAYQSLPNIIAHELIHYQQDGMKEDTTTLCYAIREGMADFIGELISGNTANSTLFEWAKGKEKNIWEKFKKDMYYDRYFNWIANSQQATPDNLPDQGYWIGYQICKAYYENSVDKKKAIDEMLHIQDYKSFLEKSKWEEKLAALK